MNQYVVWGGLGLANLPLMVIFGRWVFGDFQGFLDSVVFWIRPDFVSWWEGELLDDWWASFRLWFFVATCAAAMGAEYAVIAPHLLPVVLTP